MDHLSVGINSAPQSVLVRRLLLRQLRATLSKGQIFFPQCHIISVWLPADCQGLAVRLQVSGPGQGSCAVSWAWTDLPRRRRHTSCRCPATPAPRWNGVKKSLCKMAFASASFITSLWCAVGSTSESYDSWHVVPSLSIKSGSICHD